MSGSTIAAPTPCTARPATSISMPGASAQSTEPSVKTPMPIANSRLRPKRSATAAADSSSTAKTRVKELTVHSSPARLASRLSLSFGRAVVTTRLSRDTMNTATEVTAAVRPGWPRVSTEPGVAASVTAIAVGPLSLWGAGRSAQESHGSG
ncbi:hypothetical protein RKD42_005563 [Streptomyces ambofaciens]